MMGNVAFLSRNDLLPSRYCDTAI